MSSAERVRELDERTIEQIAAGEVVERPASVVKELVENSLDADASRVTVSVWEGGTERIQVSDDGNGMDESDATRAVEKHTTSKIGDISDLESGIRTLGFRGEALSAIGSVSRMTLRTKSQDGTRGTEITVEGGERTGCESAGCPEGTTVEITDLFYNVPARRKYLKTESTEFDHVQRVVMGYALCNPDVAITLEHNGRERFSTSGRGDLKSTVMAVYGREVARAMIEIPTDGSESTPDGPLRSIHGLVSHPETNRASREYCSTFINGRYVTARAIREAALEAYGSQLGPDRYPFAVIDVEIDPSTVDVNVHPRKLEVRFADEEAAKEQVRHVVESTLLDAGLLRSSAPRGRSAPAQTEIDPQTENESLPNPQRTTNQGGTERTRDTATEHTATADRPNTDGVNERDSERAPDRKPDHDTETSPSHGDDRDHRAHGPTLQRELSAGGKGIEPEPGRTFELEQLPRLRVLGQLSETYLVCESDAGLILIDQHAADERINYERLQQTFEADVTTQSLVEPVQLELTAREAALFEEYGDALAQLGFHASLVEGEDRVAAVRTVPAVLAESLKPELVRDLLSAFVDGDAQSTVEAAADALLADLACYPSITGNTSLTEGSIVDLVETLDACENPYACPHGRPVVIEIDHRELEERFERDYPGHTR